MKSKFLLIGSLSLALGNFAIPELALADGECTGLTPTKIVASPGLITKGTPRRDVIIGTSGDDDIRGMGGDDIICGEGGDDSISGGNGKDILFGGDGDDNLQGGNGKDEQHGGNGNDDLGGGTGSDDLFGESGDDSLNGGSGRNRLHHDNDDTSRSTDNPNNVCFTKPDSSNPLETEIECEHSTHTGVDDHGGNHKSSGG